MRARTWVLAVLAAATVVAGAAMVRPDLLGGWFGRGRPAATIELSGNIEAHESVLAFKTVQSRIVELPFDEGQWVTAGTVLARLDATDYRQQVAIDQAALEVQQRQLASAGQNLLAARRTVDSARADLEQKKLDFQRRSALWRNGFASTQDKDLATTALKQSNAVLERDQALEAVASRQVDLAQANVQNATEALKMAEIVLGYTTLYAPFDGVILVRTAELGEIMGSGTPVVTLADLDHVWLRAYINEPDIGKVRYGQAARVTNDTYPGKVYKGRVSFISSNAEFTPKTVETHAERVTLVYRIRIDIDNPTHELVPGMPADAVLDALPPGKP